MSDISAMREQILENYAIFVGARQNTTPNTSTYNLVLKFGHSVLTKAATDIYTVAIIRRRKPTPTVSVFSDTNQIELGILCGASGETPEEAYRALLKETALMIEMTFKWVVAQ